MSERELLAWVLHRLPPDRSRTLAGRAGSRYAQPRGSAITTTTMRLGHRLMLDLRAPAQRQAYLTGWFDDDLLQAARRLMRRPGDIALDVGANIGLWTVPLARHAASIGGHVVAFEPLPANVERLQANLELNDGADSVTVAPRALSDRPATAQLVLREDFHAGASTGNASIYISDGTDDRFDSATVAAERLDETAWVDDARITVVKVDVEGHEDHVFRGGRRTIARTRPVMFVEWNTKYYERRGVDPTSCVGDSLQGLDYVTARRDAHRWTVGRFFSPKPIDDLVLIPQERVSTCLGALPA